MSSHAPPPRAPAAGSLEQKEQKPGAAGSAAAGARGEFPAGFTMKSQDMKQSHLLTAAWLAADATQEHKVEKDLARAIKEGMDSSFGGPWHCVVGRSFGSFVTHESGAFAYFYIGR